MSPSHYDVLGVARDATPDEVRAAYRRLARRHHPDRMRAAGTSDDEMPRINEAYRVLSDPARRAVYDASRRTSAAPPGSRGSATSKVQDAPSARVWYDEPRRTPNMPWRTLGVAGVLGVVAVVVLAQFAEPTAPAGPDGILRVGDCVTLLGNGDAEEVACVDEPGELVVRAFVPFDATCPGRTEPHRDRQGMGVACVVERPAPSAT